MGITPAAAGGIKSFLIDIVIEVFCLIEPFLTKPCFCYKKDNTDRGISSVGRAIGSQSIGQGFESPILQR